MLVNFPTSGNHLDIYDTAKFDKLNIFDLRRNIPSKAREAKIDSANRAFGYAKRKKAKALVQVSPGNGKVYINGKPLLQSFFMPMQRSRILTPLVLTHYTCLLNVHIKVQGGGFNGQVEAIIPAMAKAVANFDTSTRKILKVFKQMKTDIRIKERKKIGKYKARKARVFRRR